MASQLDCVVVGYYETPMTGMLESSAMMQEHSGGYQHLLANTVPFRGERVRYPDLLNFAIEQATGRPSRHHVGRLPNLGACYLASFLRKKSFCAEVVNFVNHDRDLFRDLLAQSPRAVALTTTFYFDAEPIRHLVDFIRRHDPATKIVVGGPHIFHVCSDHPEKVQDRMLSQMGADVYVFDSQGDLTLSRICSELRETRPDLDTVPNLVYAAGDGTFVRTRREIENNDMDEGAVDWSTFDKSFLIPTVQTRTARSCAYKCAFCRYPILAGQLSLTSLDVVEKELAYLAANGVTHLLFIDDTFNIPKNRFKDLCRMMIKNRFGIKWFSYFRCANADDEVFDLAAESGCTGVFLGIESGDQGVLKAMNKAAKVEKYKYGIAKLKDRDVLTYASFIVGFPGETEDSARATREFIEETEPDFYCLESYFHDRKVPIAAMAEAYGITGQAYSWKHDTMDWRRAGELVEEGYRTIRGSSVVVPLYSFDLWSIAYLLGQGVSRERIDGFLRIAADMLLEGLDPAAGPDTGHEKRLIDLFREPAQDVPASPGPRPARETLRHPPLAQSQAL